jgi:putative ABC transport system permease protein
VDGASTIDIRRREIQAIKQSYSEVTDICAVFNRRDSHLYYSVINENGTVVEFNDHARTGITSDFFSFFNPETVTGDARELFVKPDGAVITESYAKKFFGNENPVGKVIKAGNRLHDREPFFTIVAVWKDFPDNCSLKNGLYYDIGEDRENHRCNAVFIKFTKTGKDDLERIMKRISRGEYWSKEEQERNAEYFNTRNCYLIPFDKIHFSNMGEGNLTTTLSLLFVGIIALVIAWINFVNFSIATASARVKSLNIHKIFGAQNGKLRLVTASESAVFSLIAFLLSIVCVSILYESLPDDLFVADLFRSNSWQMLLLIVGIFVILLGFIVGLYPAYYVTSFNPVLTLSGSPAKSKKNIRLRSILMSVQFTVCIALITVAVFMKIQHNYVVNYSCNVDTKNIICLSTLEMDESGKPNLGLIGALVEELKKNPQILEAATTYDIIGTSGSMNRQMKFNDATVFYHDYRIGPNLFKILDIPMIAGTNFHNVTSPYNSLIVNKEFVKACGMSESAIIGQPFDGDGARGAVIIGVIDNINFEDLHNPLCPLIFACGEEWRYTPKWLLIKLANNDKKNVAYIKSIWEKLCKKPFEHNFLDDHFANLYKKENNQANFLTIVCIITIIIAIMGVFGLITFNIRQKEKEIALRKIAGANIRDVLILLNRGILIQVVIAFVVAAPVAYYIVNRWLEAFAYKISMHWWIFALCGLLMCLIIIATISMQTYRAATKNPVDAIKNE